MEEVVCVYILLNRYHKLFSMCSVLKKMLTLTLNHTT